MKSVFKSVIAIMLAAAMLLAFAACNKSGNKQNTDSTTAAPQNSNAPSEVVRTAAPTLRPDVASITYTIDATAAYSSGKLSNDIMKELVGTGLLVNKAVVTLPKDSNITSTFNVFKVYGVETVVENGQINSIQGVENGACGENSRWVLKINGSEVTQALDSVTLNSGDEIIWIYVIG